MRKAILLLAIYLLTSCAHVGSGHYVQLRRGESLKDLAKEYKIPEWKIQAANRGRSIASGSWVLVPLNRGIMGASATSYTVEHFVNSGEFLWPVPASKRISSKYGHRWGRKHEGIDIAARRGSHILAANSGVVVYSGRGLGGYGNITVLAHEGGIFTIYAHADKNYTRKGQKVHRGQVIATVGSTGRSTGPHLHFEIRYNSEPMDPKKFVAFRP